MEQLPSVESSSLETEFSRYLNTLLLCSTFGACVLVLHMCMCMCIKNLLTEAESSTTCILLTSECAKFVPWYEMSCAS